MANLHSRSPWELFAEIVLKLMDNINRQLLLETMAFPWSLDAVGGNTEGVCGYEVEFGVLLT